MRTPLRRFVAVLAAGGLVVLAGSIALYWFASGRAGHGYRGSDRGSGEPFRNPPAALSMADEALGGAEGPFHPSAARSADGEAVSGELLVASRACARCHAEEAAEWAASAHGHAGLDNPWYRAVFDEARRDVGDAAARWCAGCHTPGLLLSGRLSGEVPPTSELASDPLAAEGVSCVVCHAARVESTVGQGAYELDLPTLHRLAASENTALRRLHDVLARIDPEAHRRAYSAHRAGGSELCATCHEGYLDEPLNGYRYVRLQDDYESWHASTYSGRGTVRSVHVPEPSGCAGCHMGAPGGEDGAAGPSHRFATANTALPTVFDDGEQLAAVESFLTAGWVTVDLFGMTPSPAPPSSVGDGQAAEAASPLVAPLDRLPAAVRPGDSVRLEVVVRPHGVGHFFPGGKTDLHDLWLEVNAVDARGRTVATTGGGEPGAPTPPAVHRYGVLWVDEASAPVKRHRVWDARAAAYTRRIEPTVSEVVHVRLDVPPDAEGPVRLTARLRHRKFRPELTRWAFESLGRRPPELPVVTLARDEVALRLAEPGTPLPDPGPPELELPGDAMRWNHYGVGLALQGDLRGARESFLRVVELAPEDPRGWASLGRLQVVAGNFEEGVQALERALELEPGMARAHHFIGLAARNQAEPEAALEHFRTGRAEYPRDPLILRQLATTHLRSGDFAAAAEMLDELLTVDPHDALAHFNRVRAARGLGESAVAERHQALFERFQADETAEEHALRYLAEHAHDNRERQRIHEHRAAPPRENPAEAAADGTGGDR
ncbi:MAG: tetratricopeptide repeat protein [Thermoanaerobaculia bacterium]